MDDITLNAYTVRPEEIKVGDRFGYKVILRVYPGCFCAYRGLTDWSDEHVADEGDMVSPEAARSLFPVVYDTLIASGLRYENL